MTEKATRSFSKRMAVGNIVAAWIVVAASVYRCGDSQLGTSAMSLIAFIVAGYMGVGHLDYRSVLKSKGADE